MATEMGRSCFENAYLDLSEADKMTVMKHFGYRCEIQKLIDIREDLIGSFHTNKAVRKRTKYHFTDVTTKLYYSKFLFLGRTWNTSFQVFPSSFHNRLENVMYEELQNREWPFMNVYYGSRTEVGFPDVFRQQTSVDAGYWKVDQKEYMTKNDTTLLNEYRDLVCKLFETNIERIGPKKCPEIVKEYKRIQKVFRLVC